MNTPDDLSDRYALVGYPVGHSWSPFIHGLFAKQVDHNLTYRLLETPPEQLAQTVTNFFNDGGKGLNITVPHKQAAQELVQLHTARAESAQAINTIALQDGQLLGDNTDGIGLINDLLHNLHYTLKDKRVLVLGAGGAVRGILAPLLEQQPAVVEIANRDGARAEQLAQVFKREGTIRGCSFEQIEMAPFDCIINGTSASLQGVLPPVPTAAVTSTTLCYDMAYSKQPTIFQHWAKQHGVQQAEQGLGMLVEQAAESFFLWRGVRPNTQSVRAIIESGAQ